MKIAFVVGSFPVVSETFIIDQACDLIDRGVEVDIYSFNHGRDLENISKRYFNYGLDKKTKYLSVPQDKLSRILLSLPRFISLIAKNPAVIFKFIKSPQYLKILSWDVNSFFAKDPDLYHCHFGTVALNFLIIKNILGLKQNFVTSLYGNDVSKTIKEKGPGIYCEVGKECSAFFVMSENMKQRVIAHGFPADKTIIHPVGIDLEKYPYKKKEIFGNEQINLISVGRFVEKKGFGDFLKAVAIVKEKTKKKFKCYIVGDGPLRDQIHSLAETLNLKDVIEFTGYVSIDKILSLFNNMHFFVQPSKTARDGDME